MSNIEHRTSNDVVKYNLIGHSEGAERLTRTHNVCCAQQVAHHVMPGASARAHCEARLKMRGRPCDAA